MSFKMSFEMSFEMSQSILQLVALYYSRLQSLTGLTTWPVISHGLISILFWALLNELIHRGADHRLYEPYVQHHNTGAIYRSG
jgi:hypothetical protein